MTKIIASSLFIFGLTVSSVFAQNMPIEVKFLDNLRDVHWLTHAPISDHMDIYIEESDDDDLVVAAVGLYKESTSGNDEKPVPIVEKSFPHISNFNFKISKTIQNQVVFAEDTQKATKMNNAKLVAASLHIDHVDMQGELYGLNARVKVERVDDNQHNFVQTITYYDQIMIFHGRHYFFDCNNSFESPVTVKVGPNGLARVKFVKGKCK